MRQPTVSVILLNWDGGALVVDCLRHVLAQSTPPAQIIIVDNGSRDGSPDALAQACPDAIWVRNAANRGYAAGMNQGLGVADGELCLLLNQDVLLAPGYLAEASAAMNSDGRTGMVGGKILRLVDGGKPDAVDSTGLFLRKTFSLANGPDEAGPVFGPSGACPLVRRAMLEDVALAPGMYFDDGYFAFGEDIDLWFRGHLRGWQCRYAPAAVAWHTHSGSLGGNVGLIDKPDAFQRHAMRNRYLTMVKDVPAGLALWLAPWLLVTELFSPFYLLSRRPQSLGNLASAWVQVLRLLPHAWRQRRAIQGRRTVPWGELRAYFRGFMGRLP